LDTALCGAETWTLRQIDHKKKLETVEKPFWRKMKKISSTDRLENEEVLQRIQRRMEHSYVL
jgi:predicted DNA-binding ribbon-helix-helix protein